MAELDAERAREAARQAQQMAAAAMEENGGDHSGTTPQQPAPEPAQPDINADTSSQMSTSSLLREYEVLKKELVDAKTAYDKARQKGTPEEIKAASEAYKKKNAKKRWTYNQAISRAIWPEVLL